MTANDVTLVDVTCWWVALNGGEPSAPRLQAQAHALSRGGTTWGLEYWLQPLPPPAALTLACEWPNIELSLTTATIQVDAIHDAAGRIRDLWTTGP